MLSSNEKPPTFQSPHKSSTDEDKGSDTECEDTGRTLLTGLRTYVLKYEKSLCRSYVMETTLRSQLHTFINLVQRQIDNDEDVDLAEVQPSESPQGHDAVSGAGNGSGFVSHQLGGLRRSLQQQHHSSVHGQYSPSSLVPSTQPRGPPSSRPTSADPTNTAMEHAKENGKIWLGTIHKAKGSEGFDPCGQ